MPVKIRLQRHGKKKHPVYHIVIADSRSPRDGKFIERIGVYNPQTRPATIEIDSNKALTWLTKGAQPSDTVKAILTYKGILYRKHLQRGVTKGIFSQEVADQKFEEWVKSHEGKVLGKQEALKSEKETKARKMEEEARKKREERAAAKAAAAAKAEAPAEEEPTAEEPAAEQGGESAAEEQA